MGKADDPVTVTVPLWLVTWGTCAALIPARSKDDAKAIAQARDDAKVPARSPREFFARPARTSDRERMVELYDRAVASA